MGNDFPLLRFHILSLVLTTGVACTEVSRTQAPESDDKKIEIVEDAGTAELVHQTKHKTIDPFIEVCGEIPVLEPGVPGSPGKLIPSRINPNGQSELAHAMRVMLAELNQNRDNLNEGKNAKPVDIVIHGKIRCAWPKF